MSTSICDNLRNVKSGRTDWKIKVRLIRVWKIVTRHGDVFKGLNLILLDAKNCRMHAFVPSSMTEKLGRILVNGNLYLIKNFQVKDYTTADKYRAVEMDRQIVFTTDTKIKDVEESEIYIPKNMFDLFQYADLKKRAEQLTYLTDIIGIVEKKDDINRYKKDNIPTVNVRMRISDGRKKINLTFWGPLAEELELAYTPALEQPVIIIVASAKIAAWQDEIDVCNYSPTQFYLNYDHHSVARLRKMMQDPNFSKHNFSQIKAPLKVLKINEIKNMGLDSVEEEVVSKVTIKLVEVTKDWKRNICSSCYRETTSENQEEFCTKCCRVVPHCLNRLWITTVAADETGGLELVLRDREVSTLINKTVNDLQTQDNVFPPALKSIQGNNYTVKIKVTTQNKNNTDEVYVASNIMLGWDYIPETSEQMHTKAATETTYCEPSGASYHLDTISQLETPEN